MNVLVAALSLMFAANAKGTVFYVDMVTGADVNFGTTTVLAWKTVAKVNGRNFSPGDQILFRRGRTWNESLVPHNSGTASAPITFGNFGAGALPIFDAQNVRHPIFTLTNVANVVIDGLAASNSPDVIIAVSQSTDVSILNCTLRNSFLSAIMISGVNAGLTVRGNSYTTDAGFVMANNFLENAAPLDSLTVADNVVDLTQASRANNMAGIYLSDVRNAQVSGNIIRGGTQGIGIKANARDVTGIAIFDNQVYDVEPLNGGDAESIELTGTNGFFVTAIVYRNFVKGNGITQGGIDGFGAKNCVFYQNIVFGPMDAAVSAAAFFLSSDSTNNRYYNNVTYNTPYGFAAHSASNGGIYINNIVESASIRGLYQSGATLAAEDYNIFHNSGPNLGFTAGAHDLTSAPGFVNSAPAVPGDVRLQAGSPAINSGANLGAPYNLTLDPSGSAFPYATLDQNQLGSAWERGAFGFGAAVAPPPGSAVVENENIRIYPNPMVRSQGGSRMTFANLPPFSSVKLFNLSSRLVSTLTADASGVAQWDAAVASGVYFVVVPGRQTLKAVVIN